MLYDPKWQKPDPLSVESLIAWLEKKPANGTYCWTFADTCLLGQYFYDMGFDDYITKSAFLGNHYNKFGKIAGVGVTKCGLPVSSYGAALKRAREVLANG